MKEEKTLVGNQFMESNTTAPNQLINVYFREYVDYWYGKVHWFRTSVFFLKAIQVMPRLIRDTLRDAFLELVLLMLLLLVFMQMSQGRDMIISFFEPNGNYGPTRLVFTTATIILYSISMWTIPAFLFELRDRNLARSARLASYRSSLFTKHLFFIHRFLPLFVFWGMAIIFHPHLEQRLFFLAICLVQIYPISILFDPLTYNERKKARQIVVFLYLLIIIALFAWLFHIFQDKYFESKFIYSLALAFLSVPIYAFFFWIDRKIIAGWQTNANTNPIRKYSSNSILYLFIFAVILISMWLIIFVFNQLDIAPESLLLFIFSFYIFIIDLIFYLARISRITGFFINGLLIALAFYYTLRTPSFNLTHISMDYICKSDSTFEQDLHTIDEYYLHWKERIINRKDKSKPYPIFLVSGEGGGSRAGFWLAQSMINLDSISKGRFKDHVFSISTVSGSTVGAAAVYSYWRYKLENHLPKENAWTKYPSKIFANNFTSSCVYGLTVADVWKSLYTPRDWVRDRNSHLQEDEALSIQRALYEMRFHKDIAKFTLFNRDEGLPEEEKHYLLNKNFLSFFYDKQQDTILFKTDVPLLFINTTRTSDARRGIISPVRLAAREFPDAIDISRFIYCDTFKEEGKIYIGLSRAIDFGAACNTSELFPFLSAPTMIDNLGYFVDGGYHENSGLKTTMDIYAKLLKLLGKDSLKIGVDYTINVLYFKNGWSPKKYYPGTVKQGLPALQPLTTILGVPFSGSASYFEEKAAIVADTNFINYALNYKLFTSIPDDSLLLKPKNQIAIFEDLRNDPKDKSDTLINLPLARWISNTVMIRMSYYSLYYYSTNKKLQYIINEIAKE